jgi:two-component system cell cycle response regulator CtrA
LGHLYGGIDEPESKIIDVFMCKLRRKLEKSGLANAHIQTVWGQGYVLRDDEMDQAPSLMPQQVSA